MKEGWEIKKIKDICDKGSSNVAQKDLEGHNGIYPIYGASGYIKGVDFYHQEKEYVGVVKDGSGIGRVSFYPPKSSLIGTLQYIFPKEGYDIRYVGYCLQSLNLASYRQGAAIPHIYFRDYGEREVLAAIDKKEQQRIVEILDKEFEMIDALKANAEKNLQNAKDLFQAALKKELEPREGWTTKHLNELASFSIGLTYKPDNVQPRGTIVLRSSNIQNDELALDDLVRVDCPIKQELYVKKGDILMCSRNGSRRLVGKVALIKDTEERMTYGTFMTVIRSEYNPILYYFFLSNSFRRQLESGENPMINQITKYMLNEVLVSVPTNKHEINRITTTLDELNAKCKVLQDNYTKTIALCDDLKQSLLRKAFNGEL